MKTKYFSIFSKIKLIIGNERGNVGFMGGDEGGSTEGGATDEGGTTDEGGGIQYAYPEGFDEKLKGDASLMKYATEDGKFDQAKIMKAYVHASSMIGKDKMGIPDDTWTDDQYKELYTKLGRPEDISEYGVENNISKGIEKNEEFFNGLKQSAYDAGLAPKQAQKMADFFNDFLGESVAKNNEMSEAAYEKEASQLKSDWGDKYDHKLNRAFTALQNFASPEDIQEMRSKGLMENTVITRLFDKIADGMAEDSLKVKGSNTFGMSPEEAGNEIRKYYEKGHPFSTKGHPEQSFYQNKMRQLQSIKLASKTR